MARYRVVPDRSTLFAEAKSSVHPIRAQTRGLEGWFDAEVSEEAIRFASPEGGHVEVDVERLKTGTSLYDHELDRRLEIRKYPKIKIDLREMKASGAPAVYAARADLSFHGVTKSIDGEVRVRAVDERTIEIEADKLIDMRDFRLEPPRILMLRVYPDVAIRGKVVAEREG